MRSRVLPLSLGKADRLCTSLARDSLRHAPRARDDRVVDDLALGLVVRLLRLDTAVPIERHLRESAARCQRAVAVPQEGIVVVLRDVPPPRDR